MPGACGKALKADVVQRFGSGMMLTPIVARNGADHKEADKETKLYRKQKPSYGYLRDKRIHYYVRRNEKGDKGTRVYRVLLPTSGYSGGNSRTGSN